MRVVFLGLLWTLSGCGFSANHYLLIDQSLLANDPRRADAIMAQAESEYGSRNRLLYEHGSRDDAASGRGLCAE
jgi:hypothetical protein